MANPRSQSIEFVVKPREDLSLEGKTRTLHRVSKNEQYPCQMQKNQSFSCLFRHYAKHNGLRKEDLVFYFVDELLPDETPETVHLMPYDEIWVEHRKPVVTKHNLGSMSSCLLSQQFERLLSEGEYSDVTFQLGLEKQEIRAHKAILSARSEYFRAMFRNWAESSGKPISITNYSTSTFKRMLEFIYTQHVRDLPQCGALDVIQLLMIANEYLLDDLKRMCEISASTSLNDDTVGKLLAFSDKYGALDLREACQDYISKNMAALRIHPIFRHEVAESPELALLLMDVIPERDSKRRRIEGASTDTISPHQSNHVLMMDPILPPSSTSFNLSLDPLNNNSTNTIWPASVGDNSNVLW